MSRIPGYRALNRIRRVLANLPRYAASPYAGSVPPGHYYSIIPPSPSRLPDLWANRGLRTLPGIEMREREQVALLDVFQTFYGEMPFREGDTPGLRYRFDNAFFKHGDAIILYSMLRHLRPRRVVEVGSGYSSAVMLDTRDRFALDTELVFIEPYPDRLHRLMRETDRARSKVFASPVQDAPQSVFAELEAGDILFIDSSHVLKAGSDVAYLLFEVLPSLKPGVIVHIHDIFWPFEYPRAWYEEGRLWNEAHVVRAFLQFNHAFEILYFNSFMAEHHADLLASRLPAATNDPGGSLWLQVRGP